MRSLKQALAFLTIIPLRGVAADTDAEELPHTLMWFPLVGFLFGGIAWLIAAASPQVLPPPIAAFLILAVWIFLSGAIHLDGAADFADGWGGKNPEAILRIMKDSRQGTFGVLSLILLILGKYAALWTIVSSRQGIMILLLAPAAARWCMALVAVLSPYARTQGGTGNAFTGKSRAGKLFAATLFSLVLAVLTMSYYGLLYLILAAAAAWLIRRNAIRRIGGVTGDVLGCVGEVTEVLLLLTAAVVSHLTFE